MIQNAKNILYLESKTFSYSLNQQSNHQFCPGAHNTPWAWYHCTEGPSLTHSNWVVNGHRYRPWVDPSPPNRLAFIVLGGLAWFINYDMWPWYREEQNSFWWMCVCVCVCVCALFWKNRDGSWSSIGDHDLIWNGSWWESCTKIEMGHDHQDQWLDFEMGHDEDDQDQWLLIHDPFEMGHESSWSRSWPNSWFEMGQDDHDHDLLWDGSHDQIDQDHDVIRDGSWIKMIRIMT